MGVLEFWPPNIGLNWSSMPWLRLTAGGFNGSLWVGVLVCSFIGFRFPSGLACLAQSGRKSKWKSVWGENF